IGPAREAQPSTRPPDTRPPKSLRARLNELNVAIPYHYCSLTQPVMSRTVIH
ncbi:hypothetical protein AZE42_11456, partial [Rhizopogon vesiculosus]